MEGNENRLLMWGRLRVSYGWEKGGVISYDRDKPLVGYLKGEKE